MTEKETKNCCICGEDFTGWGNNPEPFKGLTCCNDCNDRFVTPTRMCLGRNYENDTILLLLTTIAELGKVFVRMNEGWKEASRKKDEGLPSYQDMRGILKDK